MKDGVLGVTHLLYYAAFSYAGYPRPLAGGYRRLFALAPCGSVVSPRPAATSSSKESSHAAGGIVSVRCQRSPPMTHVIAVLHGGWSFLRLAPESCSPAHHSSYEANLQINPANQSPEKP